MLCDRTMPNVKPLTIAIDGPAGAGKSTVARAVAAALGYRYIDTGAMYRSVAWKSIQCAIAPDDEAAVTALAASIDIAFEPDPAGGQRVIVDGADASAAIREPEATRLSSPISAIPGVRRELVARQREMGAAGGVVMEGRDIGTVVFPGAEVKVFLTATDEERARRRWLELTQRGETVSLDDILRRQQERDARDSSRDDSPLRPAADANVVLSDGLSFEQVVARILDICHTRLAEDRP